MSTLPLELRLWRVSNRLTQRRAADTVGVSLTTWSRWERGITRPGGPEWELLRYCVAQSPGVATLPGGELAP